MDIAEEKSRLVKLTFDLVVLGAFLVLFLLMLSGLFAYYFWQYSPLYTLIGLTLFYLFGVLMLIYRIYRLLSKSSGFAQSAKELEKSFALMSRNKEEGE